MRETGVLLGEEIKAANIVADGAAELCYKAASYDLRIGDQYIDPSQNIDKSTGNVTAAAISLNDAPIVVPAYSSIVVSSHEILKLPGDVIGKFNLRIKWALKGLFVQMGTQVEPHYYGRLFAVLHNITSEDIKINRKNGNDGHNERDRLFTIEFYRIGKIAKGASADNPMSAMPDFVKDTKFARSAINMMFEKSKLFEDDIKKFKESVLNNIDDVKSRLKEDAQQVLSSAKIQVDAAMSITNMSEGHRKDSFERIDHKFDDSIKKNEDAEKRINEKISSLENSNRTILISITAGGFIVLIASAFLPMLIGYAVSKWNPSFDAMLNPVSAHVSKLDDEIKALAGKIEQGNAADSFKSVIESQQKQIESLVKRLDEFQSQSANDQSPNGDDKNGGRP